jgi:phospholipase C
MSSVVEKGFKPVRGILTEGRFLVLEAAGVAMTNPTAACAKGNNGSPKVALTPARPLHDRVLQRWVIHVAVLGGRDITFSSAVDGLFLCNGGVMCADGGRAVVFTVGFTPGQGHSFEVKGSPGKFLSVDKKKISFEGKGGFWQVFSVTG